MNALLKKILSVRPEILIFCFAFGIRLVYFSLILLWIGTKGFTAYSDAETFLTVASNMLHRGVMSQMTAEPFWPDSLRTPLYPLFLTSFIALKAPIWFIALVQNLLASLTALLVFKTAKHIFKVQAAGIIGAILFSVEPVGIYWSNLLMSDSLFSFLLFLALYLFVVKRFWWFAFILGLATLTRPTGLYFLPLFLVMFLWQYRHDLFEKWPKTTFAAWRRIFLILAIFILVLFPWSLRNKILFNTWEISSAGWLNLYIFTFTDFASEHGFELPSQPNPPVNYPVKKSDGPVFNYDFINVPFYRNQIFSVISRYPFEYLKFHFKYALKTFNYHGYSYLDEYVIRKKIGAISENLGKFLTGAGQGFWLLLYMVVIAGFFKKKHFSWLFFLSGCVFLNNILLGQSGVTQGGRYNLPIIPVILMMAGYGFWVVYSWVNNYFYVRHKRF